MKMYKLRLKFDWIFVPKVSINNIPVLVQVMAWRRPIGLKDIIGSERNIAINKAKTQLRVASVNHEPLIIHIMIARGTFTQSQNNC